MNVIIRACTVVDDNDERIIMKSMVDVDDHDHDDVYDDHAHDDPLSSRTQRKFRTRRLEYFWVPRWAPHVRRVPDPGHHLNMRLHLEYSIQFFIAYGVWQETFRTSLYLEVERNKLRGSS